MVVVVAIQYNKLFVIIAFLTLLKAYTDPYRISFN